MAIILLFRVIAFTLITLLSLVVLGICAHIEYLAGEYTDFHLSFVPFGLGVACLTILSLPLFLGLGNVRRRVFTSSIIFEVIWFFILWVLWIGTASDAAAGKAYHFPAGCVYDNSNQICYEFTVVEAFAFLNFLCAFIYYDVVFMYAIMNAIRGRGVWTASVKEAASSIPGAGNLALMAQPQFNAAPATQYQDYGAYPSSVSPMQPYNAYAQPVPPQAPPAQPYDAYPQQPSPQGFPPQPYSTYPQQGTPQGLPTVHLGQGQPYNYNPSPALPQQQVTYAGYSPSPPTNDAPLPPQPIYTSHPAHVNGSQAQLPLPSGYQEQPQQIPPPSPYGSHPASPE